MAAIEAILAAEKAAFARAVRAIITGDAAGLAAELAAEPELVSARSQARHRASLLHYVSANGIEKELQSPVPNGDAIAAIMLAAGAEVDAQLSAAAEDAWSTTLGLVASSDHPQEAGTGGRLVALLCSAGAAIDGPAGDGSPLATALAFGTLDCAEVLIARGARADNPIFAAAAGRIMWLRAWLDGLEANSYRPGRGATDAIKEVHRHICRGYTNVVDADLSKYFDTIPHSAPAVWTEHARPPRRALARVVAQMLERASGGRSQAGHWIGDG